jgi:hypothetical protein
MSGKVWEEAGACTCTPIKKRAPKSAVEPSKTTPIDPLGSPYVPGTGLENRPHAPKFADFKAHVRKSVGRSVQNSPD